MRPTSLGAAACIGLLLAGSLLLRPALGADPETPAPESIGCGLAGGTLTIAAANNGDGDFAVFGLYDAAGVRLARQYVPTYNADASPELMLTTTGSGSTVTSAKCLAETSLQRCGDPQWQTDEGFNVSLIGFLLGSDYAMVSVKARYRNPASGLAGSLDGSLAGFQLDANPVQWSVLLDSQDEAAQSFFSLPSGTHTITIGARDQDTQAFLPQDRFCFKT